MSSTVIPIENSFPKSTSNSNSESGISLWQDAWNRLLKNKLAVAGAILLSFEIILALITPWIAPYDFEAQELSRWLEPPSLTNWFGTDALGRDLFTRVLYGGRISLAVGFLASLIAVGVGVLYGAVAGFFGGKLDSLMMRTVDVLMAVPFIFVVIVLMVYFGRDIYLLFVALGLTQWLTMARIVRGQVISLKQKEFIEAAHSQGISNLHILVRHLIPNCLGPVIVYLTLTIPTIILDEAFLSFLGLGIQPPLASWGTLISSGVEVMEVRPSVLLFPAFFLAITLFSLNFLGDGLRDALDPKGSKD